MRTDVVETLLGSKKADLAIVNAQVVDVIGRRVLPDAGVAVKGDRIAKVGDIDHLIGPHTRIIDARGRYVTPGLIDPHTHGYHAQLNFTEYARMLLKRGTTAVAEGCYFAGQLAGTDGVEFFINELRRTPMSVLFVVPILSHLQNREVGLPVRPTTLDGSDLIGMLDWDGCVGVEEPPLPPIEQKEPVTVKLVDAALRRRLRIMGDTSAGLVGDQVAAYAAAGASADQECVTAEQAVDRVRNGMMVAMRECALARNQEELQRAITEYGSDPDMYMFCGDAIDAVSVDQDGFGDLAIRIAVKGGIDPIEALRIATFNPARYYRVDDEMGSLNPGRLANILVVDSLTDFSVSEVVAKGEHVVSDGEYIGILERPTYPRSFYEGVKLRRPVTVDDLRVPAPAGAGEVTVRVIGAESLAMDERHVRVPVVDGSVPPHPDGDVAKIMMIDRYGRQDTPGVGFIQGYGLRRGAIATSYNPFFNNVMAFGTNDADIALAANTVAQMKGGFVAVADGQVLSGIALPLLGLLSDGSLEDLLPQLERLYAQIADLGCTMPRPFHSVAFVAVCGSIPFIKMTDRGMFHVATRTVLPAVVD